MAGRKPKPTALKLVRGNPGKRPINRNEPIPEGPVEKPSFVKGAALRKWNRYAPELIRIGVLRSVDADMFGAWCVLMAEFAAAPSHFTAAHMSQLRGLASSFGLEPSSRSRLSVGGGAEKQDPAEKYFASG